MGKGICADSYVSDREAQELFRREMGGSGEYPYQIRQRLDRPKRRKKAVLAKHSDKKIIARRPRAMKVFRLILHKHRPCSTMCFDKKSHCSQGRRFEFHIFKPHKGGIISYD